MFVTRTLCRDGPSSERGASNVSFSIDNGASEDLQTAAVQLHDMFRFRVTLVAAAKKRVNIVSWIQ
jgi:hypothetical protein